MTNPFLKLSPMRLQRIRDALVLADNVAQFFDKYQADYDSTAIPRLLEEVEQALEETV